MYDKTKDEVERKERVMGWKDKASSQTHANTG
jgi:hypothetical protein